MGPIKLLEEELTGVFLLARKKRLSIIFRYMLSGETSARYFFALLGVR